MTKIFKFLLLVGLLDSLYPFFHHALLLPGSMGRLLACQGWRRPCAAPAPTARLFGRRLDSLRSCCCWSNRRLGSLGYLRYLGWLGAALGHWKETDGISLVMTVMTRIGRLAAFQLQPLQPRGCQHDALDCRPWLGSGQ